MAQNYNASHSASELQLKRKFGWSVHFCIAAGCCEKTDFQASRFPIDRILYLSLPFIVFFPFLSPDENPSISDSFSLSLSLSLSSAFARTVETLSLGSFIAFHFRDELTRSIGAWQKCNAREVRGHRRAIARVCEGEKQGPARQGFTRDLHCASLVSARPQGRVTKRQ